VLQYLQLSECHQAWQSVQGEHSAGPGRRRLEVAEVVAEACFRQAVVAVAEEALLSRPAGEEAEVVEERQSSGEAAERYHEAEVRAQAVTPWVEEEARSSWALLVVEQAAHLPGPEVCGWCDRAVAVVVPDLWQGVEVGC